MKAIIKATGEIAEFITGKNLQGDTILLKVGTASIFSLNEVEPIADIDWQHYRIQAAIAAMQGMVISDAYCSEEPVGPSYQIKRRKWAPARIAQEAVTYADFLIAELQNKGGQDETTE